MSQEIQDIQYKIAPILKKYGVVKAGVFGSYARGESHEESDIDLLVVFDKKTNYFDYMVLKDELEDSLGSKVDLVSERNIIPYFREYIYKDLQPIYEERQ